MGGGVLAAVAAVAVVVDDVVGTVGIGIAIGIGSYRRRLETGPAPIPTNEQSRM